MCARRVRGFVVGCLVAVTAAAAATPASAATALTPEQSQEFTRALGKILGSLDLGGLPKIELPRATGPAALPGLPSLRTGSLPGIPAPSTKALPSLPELRVPDLPGGAREGKGEPDLAALLDSLTFSWESSCGERTTVATGVLLIPTPLDVCGDPVPDVLARMTVTAAGGRIEISRLPTAAPALPLRIEAVLNDPTATGRKAAFGYDAATGGAPETFAADLLLAGTGAGTTITLNTTTAGAGESLDLIGEVFTAGEDGTRTKPQRMRLGYSPVPAVAGVLVRGGTADGLAQLTTTSPTVATLDIEDLSGEVRTAIEARIDELPSTLTLSTTEANGGRSVAYRASAAVGAIEASILEGGEEPSAETRIELAGLPTEIDVSQPSAKRTEVSTNGPIGSLLAGAATGGRVQRLADPAYLHTLVEPGRDSMVVRVLGLEAATVDAGEPLAVSATLAPGPFHALMLDGDRRFDVGVADLPSQLSLSLAGDAGRAEYAGSAPIGLLTVSASDPAGLAGRATRLDARLEAIPAELVLDLARDGDAFGVDAAPSTLGLLEASLGGVGDPVTLPADRDGLVMRDSSEQYGVFARITGLDAVRVAQRPNPDFLLDTAGGRVFVADIAQGAQTVVAEIDALAPDTHVQMSESSTGERTLSYSAASGVDRISVVADGADFGSRADHAELLLEGVPSTITVSLGSEGSDRLALDAGTGIGRLVALVSDGSSTTLPEDGVRLIDTAAQYALLAQITGLRSVAVQQRPTVSLGLRTAGDRPFRADLRQHAASGPDQTILARVVNLPAQLDLGFGQVSGGGRRLTYSASGVVSTLTVDGANLPLSGRARRLLLTLQSIPTSLTLDLGAEGGNVDLNPGAASLGLVEALLTSGPTESVPTGLDGLIVKDTAAQYTLAARISGLRRVTAQQVPLSLLLDSTAGRPFRAEVRQQALTGGKETYTLATLNNLQPNTRVSLDDSGARTLLNYSANSGASSLSLDTNSGDRRRLTGSVAPLPTSLSVCFKGDSNACGNTSRPANKGSLRILSGQRSTVNLFDCQQDNNADCSSPEKQIKVTNLALQKLELNLETGQNCVPFLGCAPEGSKGSIWLDTDNTELVGQAFVDSGGAAEITARFPAGFRSNDRFVSWTALIPSKSGSITCPSGTDLDVELFDSITVDVSGLYLC